MKRLRMASLITLILAIIAMLIWRWLLPTSADWCIRITGFILLVAVFAFVFSSIRILRRK